MEVDRLQPIPDPRICEQARLSRDPRFDGLFFTAVTSTRIYCRPVCPVPTVRREHVRYYTSAAAAEAAGFRPCLRCRPELAPGAWPRGDAVIERALKLIDDGLLVDQPLAALAQRVGVGERQLRRLFVERLGASPRSVHGTRRLLFAKQLLTETSLSITEVALEAGFGSLRRFNAAFRKAYRMAPSELRGKPHRSVDETLTLHLGYRPPYDLTRVLEFLRPRAVSGVESVDQHGYARAFGPPDAPGWLRLGALPDDDHALRLQLHCPQSVRILDVVTRLRRMFDLDADPETIHGVLVGDTRLRPLIHRYPGVRVPGGWNGFEVAVRAVLERRHGLPGAGTLSQRLALKYGHALETAFAPGLTRLFPTPQTLAESDLCSVGLSEDSAKAVRDVARALLEERLDFHPERTLEDFIARWTELPGVDDWTAHVIAMRALSHPDAFPADGELLSSTAADGRMPLTEKALIDHAERWRPWRAYAAMLLRVDTGRRPIDQPLRERGEAVHHSRRSS